MRVSRLMLITLRDVPAEADIISHQLFVRGGFIKRLTGGIYAYMPLLWKVLKKITLIVEEELSKKGCLQTLLPNCNLQKYGKKAGGGIHIQKEKVLCLALKIDKAKN